MGKLFYRQSKWRPSRTYLFLFTKSLILRSPKNTISDIMTIKICLMFSSNLFIQWQFWELQIFMNYFVVLLANRFKMVASEILHNELGISHILWRDLWILKSRILNDEIYLALYSDTDRFLLAEESNRSNNERKSNHPNN